MLVLPNEQKISSSLSLYSQNLAQSEKKIVENSRKNRDAAVRYFYNMYKAYGDDECSISDFYISKLLTLIIHKSFKL